MKPLRDEAGDELELQAAELIAQGSELPGWRPEEKEAAWERIAAAARASEPALSARLGWPLQLALASSFALLALALVLPRFNARAPATVEVAHPSAVPAAAPVNAMASASAADRGGLQSVAPAALPAHSATLIAVDLGAVGKLRVDRKAVYRLPPAAGRDYRIGLDDGTLCAEIAHRDPSTQGPLSVQTPQFEVLVVGTSFCVEVRQGVSRVSVTQGRVRVQAAIRRCLRGCRRDPRLERSAAECRPGDRCAERPAGQALARESLVSPLEPAFDVAAGGDDQASTELARRAKRAVCESGPGARPPRWGFCDCGLDLFLAAVSPGRARARSGHRDPE